jgi:outer membrane protein, multidrug efflux system
VLQAFREASDALVAVRTARDQRVAQQSQVVALRKAAGLADIRYRGGVASYLEVLDAQRQLFSAELGLSQTQLLELSSVVGLYRALGGSWKAQ